MSDAWPQERPYNPDRFSPVHPDVVLRLPEGSTRTFWLASMLGNYLKWDGSRRRLQSVDDAAGTMITRRTAKRIRSILSISPRRWRELTGEWERLGIAHRCAIGEVFLFTRSWLPECPACDGLVLLPNDAIRNSRSSRGVATSPPLNGGSPAARGEEAPPPLGTEQTHPNSGSPKGIEGYDGLKALEYLHEDSKRRGR